MQARQGWWHITKCLTIVTLCLKDVGIGVTMVKHYVICHHPCLAAYSHLVSLVFGILPSLHFHENDFLHLFHYFFNRNYSVHT